MQNPKHPPTLIIFFLTEMWERYGFYVVQALLALHLAYLGWEDKNIYSLVGCFTALTYLSPLIGGLIADKILGQKAAIIYGSMILFCGYFILALTSLLQSTTYFSETLALIAVGTGLLKPNISSLLGNEYPLDSPLREKGFTIFYMGITLGIIFGTTFPSYLMHKFGWVIAFISASVGMLVAGATFIIGTYIFKINDYTPRKLSLKNTAYAFLLLILIWLGAIIILRIPIFANITFLIVVILCILYFIIDIRSETLIQKRSTLIIGILCLISVMFWTFYFQMFLSLTLFITRAVEPTLLGFNFPAPYYVTIQSLGMLLIGYFMTKNKTASNKHELTIKQLPVTTSIKFTLSLLCMTISYGWIWLVCYFNNQTTLLSPFYLIPPYLVISIGELLISPVGLSSISFLANPLKVSTMVGIFFVSLGIGGFLSGKLAYLTAINNTEALNIYTIKKLYATSFSKIFLIILITTIFAVFLNYLIAKITKNDANKPSSVASHHLLPKGRR